MSMLDEQDNPAKLMFCCSRDYLYKLNVGSNEMDRMLDAILRLYNGLFTHFRTIDELSIATKSGLSPERVHELLKTLWRMHIIRYIPAAHSPMIYFLSERLSTKDIYIAPETYRHRYNLGLERFKSMLDYVQNSTRCRSTIIEEYFGEKSAKECGVCDICLGKKPKVFDYKSIDKRIIELISNNSLTMKDVVAKIDDDIDMITSRIDKMLQEGKISISISGKLKINE
jgi:ATP-dependent DNA helicase RecQ